MGNRSFTEKTSPRHGKDLVLETLPSMPEKTKKDQACGEKGIMWTAIFFHILFTVFIEKIAVDL